MLSKMKQILEKAYRAGTSLCPTGTSLDYGTMHIETKKLLLEVAEALDTLVTRNVARRIKLKSVVEDLLEQHERQLDMEDCGRRNSYPDKFPEWGRAWENAREMLDG